MNHVNHVNHEMESNSRANRQQRQRYVLHFLKKPFILIVCLICMKSQACKKICLTERKKKTDDSWLIACDTLYNKENNNHQNHSFGFCSNLQDKENWLNSCIHVAGEIAFDNIPLSLDKWLHTVTLIHYNPSLYTSMCDMNRAILL